MKKDVEFELHPDGELIIKHADTEHARGIVEAMKRAVAAYNKNSEEMSSAAYDPPGDENEENEDETEIETEIEPTPRERARRRRQLAERIAERGRLEATTKKASTMTMNDLTNIASSICKRADAITVKQLAAVEVEKGASLFTSFERSAMLTAVAKAADRGGGSDDQKTSRFLQDPANRLLLNWSLLHADTTALAKRDTLLDDTVDKVSSPGAAPALGGQRVYPRVTGAVLPVNKPTEADKLREAAIEQQVRLGRWQTVEEAARYVDGLQAELDRMARRKQTLARPGTMDRI
jgi:hypothetical protein